MGSGNLRGAGLRARCVFRERVTLIHCVIHARMRVGAARVRAANDGSHLPTTSHLRLDLRPGIQVIGGGVLTPRVHRRSRLTATPATSAIAPPQTHNAVSPRPRGPRKDPRP